MIRLLPNWKILELREEGVGVAGWKSFLEEMRREGERRVF